MAENIMGGGYLYNSKPFNVLNPSGISSEQSLQTLTQVGEGARDRQAQAAMQAKQIAAQERQAAADRALQEKELADRQAARDMTERLAAQRELLDQKRLSIQERRRMALEEGNLGMASQLDEEEDAYNRDIGDIERRLVGANMAESIMKGVSPDAVIKTVEDLAKMVEGRTRVVTDSLPTLTSSILEALSTAETNALSEEARTSSKIVSFLDQKMGGSALEKAGKAGADAKRAIKAAIETATDPSTLLKMGAGLLNPALSWTLTTTPTLDYEAKKAEIAEREKATRAKWGPVADELAPLVQGKASAEANVTDTIAGLLENLERAAGTEGEARRAAVAAARASYEKLRKDGADTTTLDGLLSGVYRGASKAGTIVKGVQAEEGAAKEAADEGGGPDRGIGPHKKLATMLNLLRAEIEEVPGPDGTPSRRPLMRDWGNYSGVGGTMDPNGLKDMLRDAVLTVHGLQPSEWRRVVKSLTNDDPEDDDPRFKAALEKIPPEYKTKLLAEFKRGLAEVEKARADYGLDEGDDVLSLTKKKESRLSDRARRRKEVRGDFSATARAANKEYDEGQTSLAEFLGRMGGSADGLP